MFRKRNGKKYIAFTVPIEKEATIIEKKMEKKIQKMSYIWQFIDSSRFMASSLSNIVNNLSEGIHKTNCKFGHNVKKC